MNSQPPTPDTVALSAHATWQYQQRVKPGLDLDAARDELERLRPLGEISTLRARLGQRRKTSAVLPAAR